MGGSGLNNDFFWRCWSNRRNYNWEALITKMLGLDHHVKSHGTPQITAGIHQVYFQRENISAESCINVPSRFSEHAINNGLSSLWHWPLAEQNKCSWAWNHSLAVNNPITHSLKSMSSLTAINVHIHVMKLKMNHAQIQNIFCVTISNCMSHTEHPMGCIETSTMFCVTACSSI